MRRFDSPDHAVEPVKFHQISERLRPSHFREMGVMRQGGGSAVKNRLAVASRRIDPALIFNSSLVTKVRDRHSLNPDGGRWLQNSLVLRLIHSRNRWAEAESTTS